jgi:hypothetical protein
MTGNFALGLCDEILLYVVLERTFLDKALREPLTVDACAEDVLAVNVLVLELVVLELPTAVKYLCRHPSTGHLLYLYSYIVVHFLHIFCAMVANSILNNIQQSK